MIYITEIYVSVGEIDSKTEAGVISNYIKSKFVRCMLGILKVTQVNTKKCGNL